MTRWLPTVIVAALIVSMPAPARAQVALGWNDTGPAGYHFRAFGCATNEGEEIMVASFIAPAGVTKLVHLEAVIDFCSGPNPFPDWWKMDSCRAGALSVSTVLGPDQYQFQDYWQGRGNPTVDFTQLDVNLGRMVIDIQLPEAEATPLTAATHYYAFVLTIDHRLTTGPGACAGCGSGLCFVLNDVRLVWPEGEVRLHGGEKMAIWQEDLIGCPFVVPVLPSTWSGIKTLFD